MLSSFSFSISHFLIMGERVEIDHFEAIKVDLLTNSKYLQFSSLSNLVELDFTEKILRGDTKRIV